MATPRARESLFAYHQDLFRGRRISSAEQQALLDRARAGSTEAHGALLESFRPWMHRFFHRRLPAGITRKKDADDLTQEACLNAHQGLPEFIGRQIGEYFAWLKRICQNLLATVVRRLQRERAREEALDENTSEQQRASSRREPTPEEVIAALDDAAMLDDALNRLPSEEARILVWRYSDGLTFTEIAERLHRTRRVVERAFHRAFGRLRAGVKQVTDGRLAAAMV